MERHPVPCFWSGILSCKNNIHNTVYVNVNTEFVFLFNGNCRNRVCKDLCIHRAQTIQTVDLCVKLHVLLILTIYSNNLI